MGRESSVRRSIGTRVGLMMRKAMVRCVSKKAVPLFRKEVVESGGRLWVRSRKWQAGCSALGGLRW